MSMTWEQILSTIRTAVYGKDVREGIAQGMEQVKTFRDEAASAASAAAGTNSAISVYSGLVNDGKYTIEKEDLESGYWAFSSKAANDKRLRNKNLLQVSAGTTIKYTNELQRVYFGVLETPTSNSYLQTSGWIAAGAEDQSYNIINDGWLTFMVEDTQAILPSDYNCTVSITTKTTNQINQISDTVAKATSSQGKYFLDFVSGSVNSVDGPVINNQTEIVTSDIIYFDNKFLRINVDEGYTAKVYFINNRGDKIYVQMSEGVNFFYGGSSCPVRFALKKGTSVINPIEANHITIEDYECKSNDIGCGIKEHEIEYARNCAVSKDYLYYFALNLSWASGPIAIPKSGLRINTNPKYHSTAYVQRSEDDGTLVASKVPSYRIRVVKKGSEHFTLQTDDADLLAASESATSALFNVYIPYVEDAYLIVVLNVGNGPADTDHDWSDFLQITSGEVSSSYSGVYNIFPTALDIKTDMTGFLGENALNIHGRESSWYSNSSTRYYATVVKLEDVKRIAVSPKYTILAEIFESKKDGTIVRHSDVYGIWNVTNGNAWTQSQTTTSGVSVINFSDFDFPGYALVAIQCNAQLRSMPSTAIGYAVEYETMGTLARYEDVKNNLCVEYKNSVALTYISGMPATLAENIKRLCDWKVDEYGAGFYVEQNDSVRHYFPTLYNASPMMYHGTYVANSLLMQITAKSALTCIKNPNGRMRKMQRHEGELGRIGYGLTCTTFTSVIHGLRENYTNYALIYGNNRKFNRLPFDYRTDLNILRPGDILSKHKEITEPILGREVDAHCMTVTSIVAVNGVIKAVNVIEGAIPYCRYRTFLANDYYLDNDAWIIKAFTMEDLSDYVTINRIKPEYLKPITSVFDMYPDRTEVGTVMCDRGTESIYCVGTHYIELSVTDENAENLYIYKNGVQIGTISLASAERINGLRVVNAISYIDGEGIYNVRTDSDPAVVQETFWVQGNVEAGQYEDHETTTDLTIPNISSLVFLELWYGTTATQEEATKRKSFTYVPEDFTIDEENDVGHITVPRYVGGIELHSGSRVYQTEYGTYYAGLLSTRATSEYYGYDASED